MEQERQDMDSLVRLPVAEEREERDEKEEEREDKCEEVRRPQAQHVMDKKPPWMSSLVPTPLLSLPTLNFTVSQVRHSQLSAETTVASHHSTLKQPQQQQDITAAATSAASCSSSHSKTIHSQHHLKAVTFRIAMEVVGIFFFKWCQHTLLDV